MADQPGFTVYFLSSDIQDLIDKGATDIKISGIMKDGKLEMHAEGLNTKESSNDLTASASRSATTGGDTKIPCPMPCSTSRK